MVADFKKKRSRLLNQFLLISGGILILFILILLAIADIKINQKKKKLNFQIETLKNKIQDLQNKNNDLKENISRLNDDKYVEKIAREDLDLQQPEEKVFSFIETPNQTQDNNQGEKTFLQNWLDWVGNGWQWIKSKF